MTTFSFFKPLAFFFAVFALELENYLYFCTALFETEQIKSNKSILFYSKYCPFGSVGLGINKWLLNTNMDNIILFFIYNYLQEN
jgi:hypothetical protein